jgi:DNA primase
MAKPNTPEQNKILTPKEQLKKVLKNTKFNHKKSKEYLKSRGLKNDKDIGYVPFLRVDALKGNISSSIILPIRRIDGKIVGLEVRALSEYSEQRYSKILLEDEIHLYNVKNGRFSTKVILTEGILDCKTVHENSNLNAISPIRAKVPRASLHFLAYLYNHVVVWFDKDDSGKKGAKEVKLFYKRYYPEVKVTIYKSKSKYNDPNEIFLKDPKRFTKDIEALTKITRKSS